jgi:hypothetical protein
VFILLVLIILVAINVYSVVGHQCLFYWWPLVLIILVAIGVYFISANGVYSIGGY